MNIHISRDGIEIGSWTEEQVRSFYNEGRLVATDLYWKEDMADWKQLGTLINHSIPLPPSVKAKRRTGGMTAIGVFNIVFASFGILGSLFGLLIAQALMSRSLTNDPNDVLLKLVGFGLFGLALSVVGLIAGIGIFLMRRWSRVLSLIYAGLWILNSIISFAFPFPASSPEANPTAAVISRYLGLIFGLVYPLILFFLFNKPAWKTFFSTESELRTSQN